jgi:DNA topoisomerase VI subunit B
MVTASVNGCGHEAPSKNRLERTAFRTSRLMDFCSEKELTAQMGHPPSVWPLGALKELLDNSMDACEDADIAPEITVRVRRNVIEVADNGPGIRADVVEGVLDFAIRVSSREAYISPTRGAQGNALKTLVAMPFVLDGGQGRITVKARGLRHKITVTVDQVHQRPDVKHHATPSAIQTGTVVRIHWPHSASPILEEAERRFLQLADDYTFLNPHLSLTTDWLGSITRITAGNQGWPKWRPSDPTCALHYKAGDFERLVAGYIADDRGKSRDRTVREVLKEFRGLAGTAKQKAVLAEADMARTNLSQLARAGALDSAALAKLLAALQKHSRPVRPEALGVIGKDHLAARFGSIGCKMESFRYRKVTGETDGVPWVIEAAFAWRPDAEERRLVTGVNWSPGIVNPFRALGESGESVSAVLERQHAGWDEPVVVLLHLTCPRVRFTDRGKSAVVIQAGCAKEDDWS